MTTVSNTEELKNALAKLDIPNIVKRTVYNNVVLGRTYSRDNPSNTIAIPGAGEIVITGRLYGSYQAAGVERARHHDHRTAIVRAAHKSIERNRERYSVPISDYAGVVLRTQAITDGTVVALDRTTAAELVTHSSSNQRDIHRRQETQRRNSDKRRDERVDTAIHDHSGDSRTAPDQDERRSDKLYATGAAYLLSKEKSVDRTKVA